ncbi:hypothetical protein WP3W18E02_19930 [Klebsiella sp. WP3-W18-ESBL-02]|uniref:hypothetical protein n=1 Tax=Klebsiella sp. WP3-W18-ESBL-02 TaxID=2675710 RepID=UPI0015DC173C|nr:hypothetical protein [Klebsiella sp. WP3-W18-ESBL-02]BBQ83464.1 hypothetical protein WP3W18E02_19930 [Klebsiella sp. WP3-W18-ESBL-02]
MLTEMILKEDLWKTILSAIPVITVVLKFIQYLYQAIKNGRIIKLREFYKEYGEHLDVEDKNLISKLLRKRIMSQLVVVSDEDIRNKLIYIQNRCDLKLSNRKVTVLSRQLKYNGNHFYFEINKAYKIKRKIARCAGFVYFLYGLAPMKLHRDYLFGLIPVPLMVLFSTICFLISFYMFNAYPSDKKIQGLNGKMLKVDGSRYRIKKH